MEDSDVITVKRVELARFSTLLVLSELQLPVFLGCIAAKFAAQFNERMLD